jgi:glycosyltransferase involved in cell wall biosynthesis
MPGFFLPIFGSMSRYYSFIVPVFNRPAEVKELLESFLGLQADRPFEIVLVEDGSSDRSEGIVQQHADRLNISYYYKSNTGPGDSRNYGMQRAKGDYFIILDSDVLLPQHYLKAVDAFLDRHYVDCFGGADAAHPNFSPLQKAINHVMTSFLTTGGLRGSRRAAGKFEPRSFNMGLSRKAFEASGGFGKIHPGEDPDLSLRLRELGFTTDFIPDAWLFHKRRISWVKFYRQVRKFGLVRPIITSWHPGSARLTFWFPTLFMVFSVVSVVLAVVIAPVYIMPLALYLLAILVESSLTNRSLTIGFYSVLAVFVQFYGYGWAFLSSTWKVRIRNIEPRKAYPELFFA